MSTLFFMILTQLDPVFIGVDTAEFFYYTTTSKSELFVEYMLGHTLSYVLTSWLSTSKFFTPRCQ